MDTFTPLQSIVATGLLTNPSGQFGLEIPSSLVNAINTFSSNNYSGLCQKGFERLGKPVKQVLSTLPGFITGRLPELYIAQVPSGVVISYPNNIAQEVLTQAQSFLRYGVIGLVEIMLQAYAFVQSSYVVLGSNHRNQNLNFGNIDLGHNYKNLTDTATSGVSSQFGDLASIAYQELCNNLRVLGNLYSVTPVVDSFRPAQFINNLVDQGFFYILGPIFQKFELQYSDIANISDNTLIAILDTVPLTAVKIILEQCKYSGNIDKITKLSDLLNADILLGKYALNLVDKDLNKLAERVSNVIGENSRLNSWGEIGTFLGSMVPPVLGHLATVSTDRSQLQRLQDLSGMKKQTGAGSGIFTNPTFQDVMGSFIGYEYTDAFNYMIAAQLALKNTTDGQNLYNAIEQAVNEASDVSKDSYFVTLITNYSKKIIEITDPAVLAAMNVANQSYGIIFTRLMLERQNLAAANINVNDRSPDITHIQSFVTELHSVSSDTRNLGYASFIRKAAANNVYGDAILAAIAEGENITKMESIGLQTTTTISLDEYADQLRQQMASSLRECCP